MTATPKTAGPGLPGAQCVDHVAFTVQNLDAAIAFGRDALGADLIYRLPPLAHEDDWMRRKLDVHPRAIAEIALLRLGPTTSTSSSSSTTPPAATWPRAGRARPAPCTWAYRSTTSNSLSPR